jgi:hypothetical protein
MGLAKAYPSEQDDIGFVFEELESEEVLDGHAIDFLGPAPLELLEGLDDGKPGESDFPLNGAVEPGVHFSEGEVLKVSGVCPVVCGGLVGQSFVMVEHEGKVEKLEMGLERGLFGLEGNGVLIHGLCSLWSPIVALNFRKWRGRVAAHRFREDLHAW